MTAAARKVSPWAIACIAVLLAACGDDTERKARADAVVETLPRPQEATGAITDMPAEPGPGEVPLSGEPPPPPPLFAADERFGMPALEDNPEAGLLPADDLSSDPPDAPTPADAVAVLRQYYAALDARDFAQAFGLWADAGRASGQAADGFAAGFAGTAGVEVQFGGPGPVEGAAGSRYIDVPVSVRTRRSDGGVRDDIGRVTLRRSVVDGATDAQRAWRIHAMDLREATP